MTDFSLPLHREAKLLPDGPTDGVTCLSYLPGTSSTSLLASTSWDGCVRIHDTKATDGSLQLKQFMESGPLISLAVTDLSTSIITGGLDGSIRLFETETSTPLLVGRHTKPLSDPGDCQVACSCLASLCGTAHGSSHLIASAGWHKQLHLWDTRQQDATHVVSLPGRAFSMDVDHTCNLIAVGTSGRRTCFIDVRYQPRGIYVDNAKLLIDRESSLKFPLRCLKFFPTGNAIAVGSVEGRVAVEYLEESENESKKKNFAFKCHRQGDMVFPVNCIEFHPKFGTFATGGCDGVVVLWDGLNKKKLTTLPRFPTSISAMAFNCDGSELAIASSYTFEDGEREHPKDEIYVREMADTECRPKSK